MDTKQYSKLLSIVVEKLEQLEIELMILKHENEQLKELQNKGRNKYE